MQISEIMSKSVDLTDPNSHVADAATKMREDDVGALPVGENDRLVGMITDRDIALRAVASPGTEQRNHVREVMSEGVFFVFEDESVDRAGEVMAEHQVHRLPVLNRDKRLVGMVALADLARCGPDGEQAAIRAIKGISQETGQPRR